jgi:dTDP-4-dehydrorhamnose 3,5-epimerase
MAIIKTPIKDLFVIEPRVFEDERGHFFESYNENTFQKEGLNYNFVQDNESKSQKNVLRGLHYQYGDYAQAKLVRVTQGSVLDVVCDIREGSESYGKIFGVVLSAQNKKQLMVPRGFAHGFLVLENDTVFNYKCDNFYSKDHDRGIYCLDERLNIDWGISEKEIILSEKDKNLPRFGEHQKMFL